MTFETAKRWLEAIGFRSVRQVIKHRELYELLRDGQRIVISLDRVERLGAFVELEILADEARLIAAREALRGLAEEWELRQPERRSYLELMMDLYDGRKE
jgi:adenylate cyclase class 2